MTATNSTTATMAMVTDARRRTERIRLMLSAMLDQRDKLIEMIAEAKDSEVHVALGYRSWPAYVAAELADALPRLTREERQPIVAQLTETGMSTRAVASVVGVSHPTVITDLRSGGQHSPPDEVKEDLTSDEMIVAKATESTTENAGVPIVRTVTGTDGKTYSIPPASPRRSPLPDQYRNAVWKLRKATESLQRLHEDARFLQNRAALRETWSGVLETARELVDDLELDLGGYLRCYDTECKARVLPGSAGDDGNIHRYCQTCMEKPC